MYETYTRYLYELFRDSDLFQDLKTLMVDDGAPDLSLS